MNMTTPQTMLYTHSWFTSKAYTLNSDENRHSHLTISEASMSRASSEKYPLDMIAATPQITDKIDPQLFTLALVCAFAAGIFFTLSGVTNTVIVSLFSGLFFLSAIAAFYIAFKHKVRRYTYFYSGSNTPMFSLTTKQADKEKVEQFVKNLAYLIEKSKQTHEANEIGTTNFSTQYNHEEQEYLAYTYHLDFLFASGLIDNESYLKVGENISARFFGSKQTKTELSETQKHSNIIQFPG